MRGRKAWSISQTTKTEPTFDVVFSGYDRREVDEYARGMESRVAELMAQQQESQAEIRLLAEQLHASQSELIDLRRRPAVDDKVSFSHLGLRVEQILVLAEEQAEAIRSRALEDATAVRAEADQVLAEARERNRQAATDFESVFQAMRAEAEHDIEQRRHAVEAELARARETMGRAHEEAERIVASAHTEAHRIVESSRADADRIRSEALAQARAIRAKAEEEESALAAAAEQYARETRAAAEQHAARVHAAAIAGEIGAGPDRYGGQDIGRLEIPDGSRPAPADNGATAVPADRSPTA